MATVVRAEISEKSKYWISKHRHYELKHFCLQYPVWKKAYAILSGTSIASSAAERLPSANIPGDPTAMSAIRKEYYASKIRMIEQAADEADESLYAYILKAATEGVSYTYLKSKLSIPCSRDTFYDRYRRFFWVLSKLRD